jgi:hypothetical protein
MELILKLHADFDDETATPENVPPLSTTDSFPGPENRDIPHHDDSINVGVDTPANLARHLALGVDGGSSRVPGIVELESIKQEEDEDDKAFLQLSRSTFGSLGQDSQGAAAASALVVTTPCPLLIYHPKINKLKKKIHASTNRRP